MEHMDKKIIELRNSIDNLKNKDITKKVLIKGEEFDFEEIKLFNNKLAITIPKTFEDMSLELAKIKYPLENRPQVIKSNEDGSVNLTFSYFAEQSLLEEQLEELHQKIRDGLKRMNPTIVFYSSEVIEKDFIKIVYYDFKSNTYDGALYNINFGAAIENKLFLGTFNCNITDVSEWKSVAVQMIASLKDLTRTEV